MPELFGNRAEDIACLRAEGYDIDDDNELSRKNIPHGNSHHENLPNFEQWGSRHECKCHSNNHRHEAPSIIGGTPNDDDRHLHWFLKFIPVRYTEE